MNNAAISYKLVVMITKKQKEVFDFVKTRTNEDLYAPSLEEIKKKFGFASVSTAHYHITRLKRSGFLKKQYHKARAISITESKTFVKIPFVGAIAAGQPIEAIETPHEFMTVAQSDLGVSGSHYALRVQGDSMIGEGIFDGDIVVIRKEETAQNGQTVVAIIDEGEATLKKFYRERGRIRLQPAHQSMLPIYRREVEVRGVVVRIIRSFERRPVRAASVDAFKSIKPQTTSVLSHDSIDNLDIKNPFFTSQLITYIGNKRRLLPFLYKGFYKIRQKLGKRKLVVLDGFAGSGASARLLKAFASELHVNDFEDYAETLNKTYLANRSDIDVYKLEKYIDWLNENRLKSRSRYSGFIERNYAPRDDTKIRAGERVFYTNRNAKIIDNLRRLIDRVPEPYRHFCLASLLVKASVHTNTSGVFKGFHKRNGNGHFGGNGENALSRIKKEITLDTPLFSDFECPVSVHKKDINDLVRDPKLPIFDLAYYDPPYNQHPYGSNYFMLNIINGGKAIPIQNGVSGIAKEWRRSAYNKRQVAEEAMRRLLADTRARFIAISYNDEGIIPINSFKNILSQHGRWELMDQDYNTYRGSRNLRDRDIKVKELFWILEKKEYM